MGHRLQRHMGSLATVLPGQYATDPIPLSTEQDVFICCPKCSTVQHLVDHDVDISGRVAQAWDCGYCAFHDFIELESWCV